VVGGGWGRVLVGLGCVGLLLGGCRGGFGFRGGWGVGWGVWFWLWSLVVVEVV